MSHAATSSCLTSCGDLRSKLRCPFPPLRSHSTHSTMLVAISGLSLLIYDFFIPIFAHAIPARNTFTPSHRHDRGTGLDTLCEPQGQALYHWFCLLSS